MKRVLTLMGVVGLMLLMTACEAKKDALAMNPCSTEVEVRLSSSQTVPPNNQWDFVLTIPPLSGRLVKSAFTDLGGSPYTAQVTTAEGETQVLHIDRTDVRPEPVIVPAEFCPLA